MKVTELFFLYAIILSLACQTTKILNEVLNPTRIILLFCSLLKPCIWLCMCVSVCVSVCVCLCVYVCVFS